MNITGARLQTFVPIGLYPIEVIGASRKIRLIPGIWIMRLAVPLRDEIAARLKTMPVAIEGGYNAGLLVDHDEYWLGLNERAEAKYSKDFVFGRDLAKMFVVATFLLMPVWFRLGGDFSGREVVRRGKLCASGYGHHDAEYLPDYRRHGLAIPNFASHVPIKKISTRMLALEPYFRWDTVRVDRLGAAIAHLWNSLCTPYKEQALLSVCCGLEALTSLGDKAEVRLR